MTKYAQQIFDLVLCSTEHPTAEQIFLQMSRKIPKLRKLRCITTSTRL